LEEKKEKNRIALLDARKEVYHARKEAKREIASNHKRKEREPWFKGEEKFGTQ